MSAAKWLVDIRDKVCVVNYSGGARRLHIKYRCPKCGEKSGTIPERSPSDYSKQVMRCIKCGFWEFVICKKK